MSQSNKIYIILPLYNEGIGIYNLLKKYNDFFLKHSLEHELIIINDCSLDETENWVFKAQEEFHALNIKYLKHENNKGLGGALLSGFDSIGNIDDGDLIVTMDADDTHNPLLIKEMLDKMKEGAHLVIASRYCKESKVIGLTKLRILLSFVANNLYSIIWTLKGIRDYTCNFRMYKGILIKETKRKYKDKFIEESSFVSVTELLKKVFLSCPNIITIEVPIILNYDNKTVPSNIKIINTIFKTFYILFKRF